MTAKTAILVVVGAGAVAAAGAGGFLALRVNSAERAAADAAGASEATDVTVPAVPASNAIAVSSPAPADALAEPPRSVTEPSQPALDARQDAPRATAPVRTKRPASSVSADTDPTRMSEPPAPDPAVAPPVAAVGSIPETVPPPVEAQLAAPPPVREYEELTVREDSVIGVRLDADVSSATARVEDRVTGRIARDVTVNERTAIPAGARLEGVVTLVERGGKFKTRPRIGVRFDTLILPDRTRVKIQTDTIFRDGESPSNEATAKVGASAVVGAILGAVIGGKKGAAIGGTAGAAGGTAAVMAGGRNEAVLPAGVPLTVRLTAPVTVIVDKGTD